jgi:intein/homing endonuclease
MGRAIEVTSDHSLFAVGRDGEVEAVSGREIAAGTYLATPRSIEMPGRPVSFDLERRQEFSRLWSEPRSVESSDGKTVQQVRVDATHSPLSIPPVIELDDDLAFLSGLWLADGFYDSASVGFSAGDKEVEATLRRIAERYGVHLTRHSDGVSFLVDSVPFRVLFEKTLGLTGDDCSRHVPEVFFGATKSAVASLLRGYFTGDGNASASAIYAESVSRGLLLDVHPPPEVRDQADCWDQEEKGNLRRRRRLQGLDRWGEPGLALQVFDRFRAGRSGIEDSRAKQSVGRPPRPHTRHGSRRDRA